MAFIGEIQIFGFGFAPPGWLLCDGAQLPILRYNDLYTLIGTTYGSDGHGTFRLPNLIGRAVCGQGAGDGLTERHMGTSFGAAQVSLSEDQAPEHSHGLNFFTVPADKKVNTPQTGYSLTPPSTAKIFVRADPHATMPNTLGTYAGGVDAHENRQPYLALGHYICVSSASIPTF